MNKLFNKSQNPYFGPFTPHFLRHSPPLPPKKSGPVSHSFTWVSKAGL